MKSRIKRNSITEVIKGFTLMLSSLGWIIKNPRQLGRGILPAIISLAIMIFIVFAFLTFLKPLVTISSGFTNDWSPWLANITKIALGAGLTIGLIFLCFISFVSLTLIVGDSFYNKIWKDYELSRNNFEIFDSYEPTFNEGLQAGLTIFFKGIGISILALLLTLIPFVGPAISATTSFILTAYMISFELTSKTMSARYFNTLERNVLQRNRKGVSLGYGLTFQALMIIPLGAIIAVPVSTVASAKLASLLQEDAQKASPDFIKEAEKRREAKLAEKESNKKD